MDPAALGGADRRTGARLGRRRRLQRAVGRLSERQRLAVDLVYYVDLPLAEAAQVMGCSEGTVKSTLYDARQRLRTLLEVTDD